MKHVLESKEIAGSPNYQTTRFDTLVSWVQAILQKTGADKPLDWAVNASRANSLWPMPFGTACCAIEFMATAASRFDFARLDRKSTRLNSSHPSISYAVFCLKKKNKP